MKKTLILLLCLIGLCCASYALAETYDVLDRAHRYEDKANNVEEANIYAIQCSSKPGKIYYIYQFFRDDGRPNFRAILPPNWDTPLGGKDFRTFETAVCIACAACGIEDQVEGETWYNRAEGTRATSHRILTPFVPPIH